MNCKLTITNAYMLKLKLVFAITLNKNGKRKAQKNRLIETAFILEQTYSCFVAVTCKKSRIGYSQCEFPTFFNLACYVTSIVHVWHTQHRHITY